MSKPTVEDWVRRVMIDGPYSLKNLLAEFENDRISKRQFLNHLYNKIEGAEKIVERKVES